VPEGTADAIVATGQLITALQTIVSRNVSPLEPAVLTIGTVNGGYAYNIIADKVVMEGTVRTMDTTVRDTIIKRLHEICNGFSSIFPGIVCNVDYRAGYPCTNNTDRVSVEHVRKACKKVVDDQHVSDQGCTTMGAEDFSYFLLKRPGCFWFVGSRPTHDILDRPHHKSTFDFDERALEISASSFVRLLEDRFSFSAQ